MRTATTVVAGLAASMALAGCTKPATPASEAAKPAAGTVKAAAASSIPSCTGGGPPAETFTMNVNPNFHVIHTGPNVQPNNPNPNPGQLDTYTAIQPGQSAQITINLNGGLDFDGGANAFQVKPNGALIFCGLSVNGQQMTFSTFRQSGGPTSSAYSLALKVHDPSNNGLALSVLVDPVVDNNGVDQGPKKKDDNDNQN